MKNKTKAIINLKKSNSGSYLRKFIWVLVGLFFILDLYALISMAVFQTISKNDLLGFSIFVSVLLSAIGAFLIRIPILNKILCKTRGMDFKRKYKNVILWGLSAQIYTGIGIFLGLAVIIFMCMAKHIDVIDPVVYVAIVLSSSGLLYFCFNLLWDSINEFKGKGLKKPKKIHLLKKIWVSSMFLSWGTLGGIFIGWVATLVFILLI